MTKELKKTARNWLIRSFHCPNLVGIVPFYINSVKFKCQFRSFQKSLGCILGHFRSIQAILDHFRSFQVSLDHFRSFQIILDHFRSFQVIPCFSNYVFNLRRSRGLFIQSIHFSQIYIFSSLFSFYSPPKDRTKLALNLDS